MAGYGIALAIHVGSGTLGLLLGPLVAWSDARMLRGTAAVRQLGSGYVFMVLLTCVSAVALVLLRRNDLWWLIPVSVGTFALAVLARRAIAVRGTHWVHAYAHGLGGSYIALVTATLVVSFAIDGPLTGAAELIAWLCPTAIGTVLIMLWRRRLSAGTARTAALR